MPQSTNTTAERAAAVAEALALAEDGHTANEAAQTVAENYNVSGRTIQRWAQDAGTPLGTLSQDNAKKAREISHDQYLAKREALKAQMVVIAEDLLNRIDQPHYDYRGKDSEKVHFDVAPSGDAKNYVTAAAILIDKMRLEEGKSSTNIALTLDVVQAAIAEKRELLALEGGGEVA